MMRASPAKGDPALVEAIERRAVPIRGTRDLAPLIDRIKGARLVMLGESTHGTAEFYAWRRLITQWLVTKHGFDFVAVEGDWPESHRIHEYVTEGRGFNAREVVSTFNRWPTWMWANTEVIRMAEWMKQHNSAATLNGSFGRKKVGYHGIDLYSLFESAQAVISHLERVNPMLARRARIRYGCFDRFHGDEIAYGRSTLRAPQGCEAEATASLMEVLDYRKIDSHPELFYAEQNARVVLNAERYYRAMIRGGDSSWNIRDHHMLECVQALLAHYGPESKGVIWAHNTHIGDYRATHMKESGLVNLGGLARRALGPEKVALVGFGTYQGKVIASHAWDGPIEEMTIPAAHEGSYEFAMHQVSTGLGANEILLDLSAVAEGPLRDRRGHRAVGVVYDPDNDRRGHFVPTELARRYDAFFFADQTQAIEPLILPFEKEELPQTWPMGM